jgi:hypothetical protein
MAECLDTLAQEVAKHEWTHIEFKTMELKLYAAIQAYAKDVIKKPIAYTSDSKPCFFTDTNANSRADADEAKSASRYPNFTLRLLRAA